MIQVLPRIASSISEIVSTAKSKYHGVIMAKKNNKEVFLKDYQAPAYLIDAVELDFELNPKKTKIHSRIKFRKNPNPSSSEKLTILSTPKF